MTIMIIDLAIVPLRTDPVFFLNGYEFMKKYQA